MHVWHLRAEIVITQPNIPPDIRWSLNGGQCLNMILYDRHRIYQKPSNQLGFTG